jgi:hydroxypyruvate isomerase
MPRFAANISMLYPELPFLDRFEAAAADGFRAVEFLFPYEHPPEAIGLRLAQFGLKQVLFNVSPGDWPAGERGMACHPGREAEFMRTIEQALPYAHATGCRSLHVMSGRSPGGHAATDARQTLVANLRRAARRVREEGITLLIEPINTRDMPGYFLNYQQQAHDIVTEVDEPNLKVQMDFYHCQIMEGDLARRLERHIGGVGHVQIAGVPDRHEPDFGEVNYPYLFDCLDALGYDGWVGCEYRPRGSTSAGLGWLRSHLHRPSTTTGPVAAFTR